MIWLKKNWLNVTLIIVVALFIISYLDLGLANKQYKAKIATLDIDIQHLRANNKTIRGINNDLRIVRAEDKAAAEKKIADMEENQKRELARIGTERDKWKAKVKVMPPSELMLEIKVVLKTDEVWERPDGILFSLVAAKDCLAILGDFSIAEERDRWKDDYFKAMESIKEKDNIIATDEFIFHNFDAICFTKDEIIDKEREQFALSEKRNVASYIKGLKHGAPIGGAVIALLWLVLGR